MSKGFGTGRPSQKDENPPHKKWVSVQRYVDGALYRSNIRFEQLWKQDYAEVERRALGWVLWKMGKNPKYGEYSKSFISTGKNAVTFLGWMVCVMIIRRMNEDGFQPKDWKGSDFWVDKS